MVGHWVVSWGHDSAALTAEMSVEFGVSKLVDRWAASKAYQRAALKALQRADKWEKR